MEERKQIQTTMARLINDIYDTENKAIIRFFNQSVVDFLLDVQVKLAEYNRGLLKCK